MDATTRWETEAMRSSPQKRSNPPRPTAKRQTYEPGSGMFVTLKEAEDATGIPMNTLRKWVRKDAIKSYLESDGEVTLRMVDLESVKNRARELGRKLTDNRQPESDEPDGADPTSDVRRPTSAADDLPQGSMLVPIDAWNKMLTQLGNLHEAGQQLAEARERAAKAETEAVFLRERLAEMRAQKSEVRSQKSDAEPSPLQGGQASEASQEPIPSPLQGGGASEASQGGARAREPGPPENATGNAPADPTSDVRRPTSERETTSYWRYLTTGWRSRKKR